MPKTHVCTICGKDKSPFVMNNKQVCFQCDELLFDMEIECEETATRETADGAKKAGVPARPTDKKAVR